MYTALRLLVVISGLAAIGFLSIGVYRALLPYNSEGVYFDQASSTTYNEQTALVAFILSIGAMLFTIVLAIGARRVRPRPKASLH